jgi:hypothetical protein
MNKPYRLDDAEALHLENPRTFSIPRRAVRDSLPIDESQAKLVFLLDGEQADECRAERMWCLVRRREGDEYVGELASDPQYLRGLVRGDEVRFSPRHVVGVTFREEEEMAPLVGCDLGVLRQGQWPTWLARVTPSLEQDSGWRVFAEPTKTGARVRAVSARTMLRSWAVLDSVIDGDTEGVWRWDPVALEFVSVDALPPELAAAADAGLGRLHEMPPKPQMKAIVTHSALERPPLTAQRLSTTEGHDDDSGWVFYVGDEPQAYLDDANNCEVVPFARLYHLYPYLERVAGEEGERAWEWDDTLGDFREIDLPPDADA